MPKVCVTMAKACLLALLLCGATLAHAEALHQATGEAILEELKAMRATLERIEKSGAVAAKPTQRPSTATVGIAERPVVGTPDAPVTLVEFTDYQCPYCVRFTKTTFAQLKEAYVDTGKLRIVVKDTPLAMHANARKAAQASHCAGEQDAYWPMHMALFDNAKQLDEASLPGYAAILKLDMEEFSACLGSDRHLQSISADILEANKVGISGTPSFVLGVSNGDKVQGNIIQGAQPFDEFKRQIDALLVEQAEG
jgi:protein-disulfide isomerase